LRHNDIKVLRVSTISGACPRIGIFSQIEAFSKNKHRHESVDLLGFWFEIETYEKNNHKHIVDIPRIIFFALRRYRAKRQLINGLRHIVDISESRASLTGALFFVNNKELGKHGTLGQPPRLNLLNSPTISCLSR